MTPAVGLIKKVYAELHASGVTLCAGQNGKVLLTQCKTIARIPP